MKIVLLARRLRVRPGETASALIGICEEAALRAAFAARAGRSGATITAIAAGPPESEDDLLRGLLARGVDRAVRVSDAALAAVDYYGIARVLAAATKHVGYDLVLAGDRSEDEGYGAVGPAVAEALGIVHLSGAHDVAPADGVVRAVRRDAGRLRTLVLPLPALLAVVSQAASPAGDARQGEITSLDLAALGIQPPELRHRDRCVGRISPTRPSRSATVLARPADLIARLDEDHLLD